jgi:Spy/CpxP family protein refolding chaperone
LLGRGFEWWNDDEVRREIRLTDDKANRIESMYAKLEKDRTPLLKELEHEWARLDKMTKERTADETAYGVQVRKFESLAASWREMRTVLMYQMYKELKPEQYAKLQEIVERRFSGPSDGRGRGPGAAPTQGSGR